MPVFADPVVGEIDDSATTHDRSAERLRVHREALERHGISDLAGLGTLNLSGTVPAAPGIVVAPPLVTPALPTPVRLPLGPLPIPRFGTSPLMPPTPAPVGLPLSVLLSRLDGARTVLEPGFVLSTPLTGSLVPPQADDVVQLDVAYFVGQTVVLADDTVVVLRGPHRYLTFIAEELRVGRNVTFTYEHPLPASSPESHPPGDRPGTPGKAPTPDGLWGVTGDAGGPGRRGGPGFNGVAAPEIELWALQMSGSPVFDLRGQDGGNGGRGQDGGNGGEGSDGRAEAYDWFLGIPICKSGAGWGGDGGPGGDGGDGGPGGHGGDGGRLTVYAPRPVLETYAAGGFTISIDGGSGGRGGEPGAPGAGGRGGRLGDRPQNCPMSEQRHDGAAGAQGRQGSTGAAGDAGHISGADGGTRGAVAFRPVTEAEFRENLTRPGLVSATPDRGRAGDPVTLATLRVTPTDTLLLDEDPVPMTVVADTLVTFVLPTATGGFRVLRIRQADGTLSNRMSFYVLPQVNAVGDGGRQRPGATVAITGSGFAAGARVQVNGEEMADAVVVNQSTMTFTLHRPASTVEAPDGETGHLTVVLADGTPSNTADFVIDTLRIVVLGDSVAWGQGLRPHEKFTTLVENRLAADGAGIKSYTTMLAHSGATIGIGDLTSLAPIEGEVPTSYPTAMQQIDLFSGDPAAVDLVVVTAGLNDVNIRTILDPTATPLRFAPAVSQHCHRDLRTLLTAAAQRFPHAVLVATAYYPVVSDDSDTGLLEAFLVGLGILLGGPAGGIATSLMIPQLVTNCRAFHELSTLAIRSAVDDVNDSLPSPRVGFADPGFGPRNAALASEPWLYGINADLSPQDPFTAGDRAAACHLNAARTDEFQCARASVGHPNPAGAAAYAGAVVEAARTATADRDLALPPFPPNFLFGVATAAMQNEGNITDNDWGAFATSPAIAKRVATITEKGGGPVAHLSPPGRAIEHSDPAVLAADLDRAVALRITSYRFSVEWARICPSRPPEGRPLVDDDFDAAALAYYDGVLAELAARSLTPMLTLNHLTLPLWVLDPPRDGTFSLASFGGIEVASAGDPNFMASLRGWENPATVNEYVRLVSYLVGRWSTSVTWWVTVNEPVGSMIGAGYLAGVWPPGFTGDGPRGKTAYFNLIRAHLRAYEAIKAVDPSAMVGFAHAMLSARTTYEHTDHLLGDQDAARNQFDYFYNWHMLDAVIHGRLDTEIARRSADRRYLEGPVLAADAGIDPNVPWRPHCDFVGINYYRNVYVFNDQAVSIAAGYSGGRFVNDLHRGGQVHQLLNPLGWEIAPGGLGALMRAVSESYSLPIVITENGVPQVRDTTRAAFLTAHLTELRSALASGVDIRGYFHWTLADNWEWHEGYRPESRFGLFTVDRESSGLTRHLTEGAQAYAHAIGTGGAGGLRDQFGTITVGGDLIRPPRLSPLFVSGTAGGDPIELSIRSAGAEVLGLMFEAASDRYLPLRGRVDAATIHLTHPAVRNVGPGELVLGRDATDPVAFTGVLHRDGTEHPVVAARDPLVGQWAASGSPGLTRVQITRAPGGVVGHVGAWMGDDLPRAWEPLTVSVTGTDVSLDFDGGRLAATVDGPSLVGTLTVLATSSPWTGNRLPDPLG